MNFKSIIGATCACLAVVSFNAHAALEPRLGGLAYYDTEANLTWLTDTNYALTTNAAFDGRMTWDDANTWVATLNIAGITGWRLPTSDTCYGYNCTDSEMGNLYYNVLGNDHQTYYQNYGPFINATILFEYWSGTEDVDPTRAWAFNMGGGQYDLAKDNKSLSWVVHSGDVGGITADYVSITHTSTLTDTTQLAYQPILGQDAISKLVVYSAAPSNGGFSSIYYQRLNADGSLQGSAMQVSSGLTHDILHDVSGKYIVYSARDHDQTANGRVVVFNLETGVATPILNTTAVVGTARVHGDYISWIQSSGSNTWILYYNIAWLGTGAAPVIVAGPSPSPIDLEMGDKYITWSQYVTAGEVTYAQAMAYDIQTDAYYLVEDDSSYDNREPAIAGEWAFYQQQTRDGSFAQVKGVNLGTGEERLVGEHSTYSFQPSFDGEYVGYDALVGDSAEIFVYRMSDGKHFQITSLPGNQLLNNVYGQDIAYVDMADNNRIIKVAHFEIIPANIRPIANAGADQTVHAGSLVTLDGSASSDPDENYALSYSWSITSSPANSTATLVNENSVSPTFTADQSGNYAMALTVTDSLGLSSTSDSVTVSTSNTAPVADAGTDQSVTVLGAAVTLDGSQSYDLESDALSYAWSLLEKPAGSLAELSDPGAIMPVFVADVQGAYVAQLIVSDPWASSNASTVTVSFNNIAPIANAGSNQSVSVGDSVNISGLASSDVNGDSLSYQWGFVSVPTGSQVNLLNDTNAATSFVADAAGTYVLSLVVNDGLVNSNPNNISIMLQPLKVRWLI